MSIRCMEDSEIEIVHHVLVETRKVTIRGSCATRGRLTLATCKERGGGGEDK